MAIASLSGAPASGSVPEPESVTVVRSFAVWSGPAFAVGARFTPLTVTRTTSVALAPEASVTVSVRS